MFPSVALVGKQGSGKSSIAQALIAHHGFLRMSWAEPVRQIFEMAYGQIVDYAAMKAQLYEVTLSDGTTALRTGRELLQRIGTDALREHVDQDFWIKAGVQRIWRSNMCNDDTRFLNEAAALRRLSWVIVRISAPEEVRRQRIGGGFVDGGHSSEIEQEHIEVDLDIINDGTFTPQDLTARVLIPFMSSFSQEDLINRVSLSDLP